MHFVQALLTDMISFVSILLEIILLISSVGIMVLLLKLMEVITQSRRFTNDEVLYDLENVLYEIEQNLK